MCLLDEIPFWIKIVYHFHGVIQFTCSCKNPSNSLSQFISVLWSFVLFSFYSFCSVLSFYLFVREIESNLVKVEVIISTANIFFSLISIVIYFLRRNKLKKILKELYEVKTDFSLSAQKDGNNWIKISLFVTVVLNLCCLPNLNKSWMSLYLILAYYVIPVGMAFLNHLFLSDILEAVRVEFNTINRELERVVNRTDLNLIFPLTKISKIKQLEESDKTFSILRIEELSFLHYNLVHQLLQVLKLFDVTIIISMVLWFGYVIILTYKFMEPIVDGYLEDLAEILYVTTNLLFYYLWLFILISTLSRTQREANKTSVYVHQIWNQYYRKGCLDEKTRHLQLISVRMLNTKLSFTARNFFNLDETFFHTMMAAIVTYMVILVQFGFRSF
ncbi:hypothetical protein Zmor_020429 [Zophobas morio]|uniref:Gustatory receptor n=1 Tax=Zophobas morio TaxID=2755281 RepID=A0AA38M9P4_9CUCU|nr:hypothetical protein Zmor_020429 [Zophobas morio]